MPEHNKIDMLDIFDKLNAFIKNSCKKSISITYLEKSNNSNDNYVFNIINSSYITYTVDVKYVDTMMNYTLTLKIYRNYYFNVNDGCYKSNDEKVDVYSISNIENFQYLESNNEICFKSVDKSICIRLVNDTQVKKEENNTVKDMTTDKDYNIKEDIIRIKNYLTSIAESINDIKFELNNIKFQQNKNFKSNQDVFPLGYPPSQQNTIVYNDKFYGGGSNVQ